MKKGMKCSLESECRAKAKERSIEAFDTDDENFQHSAI